MPNCCHNVIHVVSISDIYCSLKWILISKKTEFGFGKLENPNSHSQGPVVVLQLVAQRGNHAVQTAMARRQRTPPSPHYRQTWRRSGTEFQTDLYFFAITEVFTLQSLGIIGGLSSESSAFPHCVKHKAQTFLTHRHLAWLQWATEKLKVGQII